MVRTFNRFYDKLYEIPFYKVVIVYLIIACLFSTFLIFYVKNFVDNSDDQYIFLETNIEEMIEKKDFSNDKLIILKSCNLDLLSDTLTLEAKYKSVAVQVEVKDYSGVDKKVEINRINSLKGISSSSLIVISILIGFFSCFVLFIALHLLISMVHFLLNHIFT